jgi:hypothetical protein
VLYREFIVNALGEKFQIGKEKFGIFIKSRDAAE